MFGFVVANKDSLSVEEMARYHNCYCGLCKTLRERYGGFARITLNYDMTFLVILLTALYEPAEEQGEERCAVILFKSMATGAANIPNMPRP